MSAIDPCCEGGTCCSKNDGTGCCCSRARDKAREVWVGDDQPLIELRGDK